jgi:hypothetical protein
LGGLQFEATQDVNWKRCSQKTLVLAFQRGRIQAEFVGANGVYKKLGKGSTKGSYLEKPFSKKGW